MSEAFTEINAGLFFGRARCLSAGLRNLRLTRLPRHDRGPVPRGNRSAASCLCTVLRRALYHYTTRSPTESNAGLVIVLKSGHYPPVDYNLLRATNKDSDDVVEVASQAYHKHVERYLSTTSLPADVQPAVASSLLASPLLGGSHYRCIADGAPAVHWCRPKQWVKWMLSNQTEWAEDSLMTGQPIRVHCRGLGGGLLSSDHDYDIFLQNHAEHKVYGPSLAMVDDWLQKITTRANQVCS